MISQKLSHIYELGWDWRIVRSRQLGPGYTVRAWKIIKPVRDSRLIKWLECVSGSGGSLEEAIDQCFLHVLEKETPKLVKLPLSGDKNETR